MGNMDNEELLKLATTDPEAFAKAVQAAVQERADATTTNLLQKRDQLMEEVKPVRRAAKTFGLAGAVELEQFLAGLKDKGISLDDLETLVARAHDDKPASPPPPAAGGGNGDEDEELRKRVAERVAAALAEEKAKWDKAELDPFKEQLEAQTKELADKDQAMAALRYESRLRPLVPELKGRFFQHFANDLKPFVTEKDGEFFGWNPKKEAHVVGDKGPATLDEVVQKLRQGQDGPWESDMSAYFPARAKGGGLSGLESTEGADVDPLDAATDVVGVLKAIGA